MALIAWGCRLEFSKVNAQEVRQFIREKGIYMQIYKNIFIILKKNLNLSEKNPFYLQL